MFVEDEAVVLTAVVHGETLVERLCGEAVRPKRGDLLGLLGFTHGCMLARTNRTPLRPLAWAQTGEITA